MQGPALPGSLRNRYFCWAGTQGRPTPPVLVAWLLGNLHWLLLAREAGADGQWNIPLGQGSGLGLAGGDFWGDLLSGEAVCLFWDWGSMPIASE